MLSTLQQKPTVVPHTVLAVEHRIHWKYSGELTMTSLTGDVGTKTNRVVEGLEILQPVKLQ